MKIHVPCRSFALREMLVIMLVFGVLTGAAMLSLFLVRRYAAPAPAEPPVPALTATVVAGMQPLAMAHLMQPAWLCYTSTLGAYAT